jgi:hypothetical protein
MNISSVNGFASSASSSSVGRQRRMDMQALGAALQKGDLAGAQSAFADLTKLMRGDGTLLTTYAGVALSRSFIDSGSNGDFFNGGSIPACKSQTVF